jgi:aldehyde dehydrogenase (NAD+)
VCPRSELYIGVKKLRTFLIILGVISLVIMMGLSYNGIRKVVAPIEDFSDVAKKIANGEFNARLPKIKSQDELKDLHDSFKYLQDSLVKYIDELKSTTANKERIESELRIAQSIQMGMLPKSFPAFPEREDIALAAKRIAWGKTLNSGQTCIAPDYILIHKDVKDSFVKAFATEIRNLHGEDIKADYHYVRMVNDKAFERVTGYFKDGKIIYGGRTDAAERFIEPTLIEDVALDSPLMTEEIFGPVFPVITMDDTDKPFRTKVIDFVTSREKPLAFYYFGKEADGWEIIRRTSSGGGCINDVIMHIANENIPFGGVGNSGMGRYHDKDSFEAFSHTRSIVATGTWIDLPFRYMPYKMFGLVKKIL